MERRREQVLGLLWWAAMAGVSWLVLRYALVWLLPFLLALGAAALLEPLIVRAQRRLHLRRSFTAAVLTLVLVGGVLAVLIALAVQVVEQAVALVSSLPELLAALPETMASLERRLEGFCAACPDGVRQTAEHMLDSLPRRAAELAGQVSSAVLQGAGRAMAALPRVLLACGTTVLAVFFTLSAYPAVRGFFRRQLGSRLERARGVKSSVFATLGKWLKAECILLAVTFCQLLAGLLLMRQEYALLLAGADRPDRRAAGVRNGDGAGALGGSGMPAGRRAPGHRAAGAVCGDLRGAQRAGAQADGGPGGTAAAGVAVRHVRGLLRHGRGGDGAGPHGADAGEAAAGRRLYPAVEVVATQKR